MNSLAPSSDDKSSHYNHTGWVRRIDLSLRSHYPNLETRIFEIRRDQFVIVFDREVLDAKAIGDEFHKNIRFVTTNATISNDLPTNYLREIPAILDDEIAKDYAGIPFSLPRARRFLEEAGANRGGAFAANRGRAA